MTNGTNAGTLYASSRSRSAGGAVARLRPLGVASARMFGTLDPYTRHLGWKIQRHYAAASDVACLRALLGPQTAVTQTNIETLLHELLASPHLSQTLSTHQAEIWWPELHGLTAEQRVARVLNLGGTGRGRALLLYVTARILRPNVIVETGCFTGWDSAVLLQALEHNGAGHLYTIDLPATPGESDPLLPGGGMPLGLSPGCLVPEALKDGWSLAFGDSRRELPALLSRVGEVGLFFHDSDHSYLHMIWEYATVWPHIGRGGLLVSDDISMNTAFVDFAHGCDRRPVIHRTNANVGALRA